MQLIGFARCDPPGVYTGLDAVFEFQLCIVDVPEDATETTYHVVCGVASETDSAIKVIVGARVTSVELIVESIVATAVVTIARAALLGIGRWNEERGDSEKGEACDSDRTFHLSNLQVMCSAKLHGLSRRTHFGNVSCVFQEQLRHFGFSM